LVSIFLFVYSDYIYFISFKLHVVLYTLFLVWRVFDFIFFWFINFNYLFITTFGVCLIKLINYLVPTTTNINTLLVKYYLWPTYNSLKFNKDFYILPHTKQFNFVFDQSRFSDLSVFRGYGVTTDFSIIKHLYGVQRFRSMLSPYSTVIDYKPVWYKSTLGGTYSKLTCLSISTTRYQLHTNFIFKSPTRLVYKDELLKQLRQFRWLFLYNPVSANSIRSLFTDKGSLPTSEGLRFLTSRMLVTNLNSNNLLRKKLYLKSPTGEFTTNKPVTYPNICGYRLHYFYKYSTQFGFLVPNRARATSAFVGLKATNKPETTLSLFKFFTTQYGVKFNYNLL